MIHCCFPNSWSIFLIQLTRVINKSNLTKKAIFYQFIYQIHRLGYRHASEKQYIWFVIYVILYNWLGWCLFINFNSLWDNYILFFSTWRMWIHMIYILFRDFPLNMCENKHPFKKYFFFHLKLLPVFGKS